MSDDEEVVVKKAKQVHYGSLEEQEKARLAALAAAAREGVEDNGGKDLGDIQISNEYMELEEEMSKDKKALLEEFERRRKARQLNVSTDDDEEEARIERDRGREGTWYHEGPPELRDARLWIARYSLPRAKQRLGEDAIHKKLEEEEARIERDRGREGTWYHEGPPELRDARLWIARYSLPRAKQRLMKAREDLKLPGSVRAAAKQESQRKASAMSIYCSQIGDSRPISFCRFSDDSQMLITSSCEGPMASLEGHGPARVARVEFHPSGRFLATTVFDNSWRLWDLETATEVLHQEGHAKQVYSIAFQGDGSLAATGEGPMASLEGHGPARVARVEFHPSGRFLATTVFDNSWRLWDLETATEVLHQEGHAKQVYSIAFQGDGSLAATGEGPMASLEGHGPARVARVEFHPSGRFLATTVFDNSWRLWDLETATEVLHQEGHAKQVYSIAFQGDGSLAATGGMDAFGRVWDVRTGRCVMFLEGHLGPVLGAAWHPAGHRLATAAADHQAYTYIHKYIMFFVKIWDIRKRAPIYTIPAHTHLVSDVRYQRSHGHYLATSSYDGSGKLWSDPAWHPLRTLSGHDNKVMSVDISLDNKYIATCSYDRTFKLWAPDLA
ncbi:U4/U6 small nuclear ribonucleoprotein Prp4 [Papilio machaon]|uniref:U4/U6 small nuclear ribonucleoprotein Prp4 n=1 Tax=Papilio machaon TaxID=76193 RepID=A0A0N1PHQ1_PAPMA|nr:U4/U6 small nuclear ribonucleoprotein Prp4 [Papilio machaon]